MQLPAARFNLPSTSVDALDGWLIDQVRSDPPPQALSTAAEIQAYLAEAEARRKARQDPLPRSEIPPLGAGLVQRVEEVKATQQPFQWQIPIYRPLAVPQTGGYTRTEAPGIVLIPHPIGDGLQVRVECKEPILTAYCKRLMAEIERLDGAIRVTGRRGRPPGSYKYQDQSTFTKHVEIAVRAYWYHEGKLPSKATIAKALRIDEETLDAALNRFQLTDRTLQEMTADLD